MLTGRWLQLFVEIWSSGDRWRDRIRNKIIAPLVPAPLFRRYKQWRRGGNQPWHDISLIRPEFAAQTRIFDRAAREGMPYDMPLICDSRLSRVKDFRAFYETADWFAKVRANFRVDMRTPAFDQRLVEFCIGIPQDQYLREGRDRWLIRRAMEGRLPDSVLTKKKWGAQAADWYPRLTRDRNLIADEVRRLAKNAEVASVLDMKRLTAILDSWPDHQPPDGTPEEKHLLAIPEALGAAYYIESLTGTN
jgi:asparagine synthase (glutamine-hydrolysing)